MRACVTQTKYCDLISNEPFVVFKVDIVILKKLSFF